MLSIIIASHDRKEEIKNNLKKMKDNYVFKNINAKIILVFDGNIISEEEVKQIGQFNPCNNEIEIIACEHHKGQNYIRNLGIKKSKEFETDLILFLDDDAFLSNNKELSRAIEIINSNKKIGALGLNVIKTINMQPQYYTNCKKETEIFPVLFPCLAGTLVKSEVVYKYKKFFFPEEIYYGADEWALAIRVRQLGLQVYATNACRVFHNIVGGGRSKDIRFKYQYAHSYIWGSVLCKRDIIILLMIRTVSLIKTSLTKNERKYFNQKIIGLYKGLKDGIKNKSDINYKYNLHINDKKLFNKFMSESFKERNGLLNNIVSKLI